MRRMMMGGVLVGLLGALAWGAEDAPLVIGPEVRTLGVVRTRGELEKQPVLQDVPGQKIHVGLEAAEGPQGTCVLIYCLVKAEGEEFEEENGNRKRRLAGGFEPLGPLAFRVIHEAENEMGDVRKSLEAMSLGLRWTLFAAPIPLDRPGKLRIEVQAGDGTLLAKGAVTVREKEADAWYPWKVANGEAQPVSVGLERRPAVPRWDGNLPVAWDGQEKLIKKGEGEGGGGELETFVPRVAERRLELKMEKGELRLSSKVDLREEAGFYLTQWRVNGKAVRLVPDEVRESMQARMKDEEELHALPMTVSWGVGEAVRAIGAKAGDKVEVQVLYCRDGWVDAPGRIKVMQKVRMPELEGPMVMVSNKAEWTVGAEEGGK